MKGRTYKEAAILAGYPKKNAAQSGYQALHGKNIHSKVTQMLDEAELSVHDVIHKYLKPLLRASETRFFAHEGKIQDYVEVDDNAIRLDASKTILNMHGAYAPKNPAEAAQFGVKVIVIDVPRPKFDLPSIGPGDPLPDFDKLEAEWAAKQNGHKKQE